jgi:cytochrome P450
VPHRLTQDDEYKGYLIPEGTIVIGLVWFVHFRTHLLDEIVDHAHVYRSILHNTEDYPDPERFMPERYLTPEGTLDPSVRNPRTACFGSGRRICPGQYVADATLFITVATLLATVDIVRAKDADGVEIVPEVAVTSELVSHAKPFPWAARPRSREAAALLATTIEMIDLA